MAAPHGPVPWFVATALVVAGVLLARAWWDPPAAEGQPARPAPVAVAQPAPALPWMRAPAPLPTRADSAPVAPPPAPPSTMVLDATAPDLRRLHDDHSDSADPRERRMAARAFTACIPLFVPAAGETPSPEPLIRGLPAGARAEREQAWRTLFARCHGFAGERGDAIAALQAQLQGDPAAQDPGERARQAVVNGEIDEAQRIVAQVLSAADPAAVAALSGLAAKVAASAGANDPAAPQHAAAVDAALPLVACDLGLDCSAQALAALQLCALEGACSGNLAARLASRQGSGGPDAAAVEAQRLRLRTLLASGRVLGLGDLLP